MRRLVLPLRLTLQPVLLLLLVQLASADYIRYYPPASGTFTGGTFTSPLLGPGNVAVPTYSFTGNADTGVTLVAASTVGLMAGGFTVFYGDATNAYFNFPVTIGANTTNDQFKLSPPVIGAGSFLGTITSADLTGARSWKFPNQDGTVPAVGTGFAVVTGDGTAAAREIAAGTGISVANGPGTAGNPTVSIDTTTTPQFLSGLAAALPGTCTLGTEYLATDTNASCKCVDTSNTWQCDSGANTGDVSLAGTPDYVTISGQTITRGKIDVADLADGTDGQLITWDAAGAPATVAVGTSGQVLTSNGAGAAPTFQAAPGAFEPSTTFQLYEEFIGGNTSGGTIGANGFATVAVGSGSSVALAPGTAENWGVFSMTTGATDNSGQVLYPASTSVDAIAGVWSTHDWQIEWGIDLGTVTTQAIWVGLTAGNPDSATNAIRIMRDTDLSHTTFVFAICDSATTGCQSAGDATNQDSELSTITPSSNVFYRFRIRHCLTCGPAGVEMIGMRVGTETEVTFCSSGCNSTMANLGIVTGMRSMVTVLARAAATSVTARVDYCYMKIEGLSRF